jgi:hypothetical protein
MAVGVLVSEADGVQTFRCAAGHEWSRPKTGGQWPKYCSDHALWFLQQLSGRVKPPKRVMQEWLEQGELLDDEDYADRWRKKWTDTVRVIAATHETWNAVDVDLVEKYVRALRLAELYRLYAQDAPFNTTSKGTTRPHPGWTMSEKEEAKAAACASQLGLAGSEPVQPSSNGHAKPVDAYHQSRLQQSAAEHTGISSVVGPDGSAL